MNADTPTIRYSNPCNMFTSASFIVAASMMAGGTFVLERSPAAKGFHALAALMLVHTPASIIKTLRDNEEASRLINGSRMPRPGSSPWGSAVPPDWR